MAKRLAYFENWLDPIAEDILGRAPGIELVRLRYDDPVEMNMALLASAHGYQISPATELRDPWRVAEPLLALCPDLLAVSCPGAGYDTIDVDACTARGVLVCNQSGTHHISIAEHAIGMMLALAKRHQFYRNFMRSEVPQNRFDYPTSEITGKTVGIVGLGAIGAHTAALCRSAFGCEIIAFDPVLTEEQVSTRGASKVSLDELLERADIISVHCPLTAETRGLFGAREFAAMRPDALFITTARGHVHDEDALVQALADKRIAGAGVDVFSVEPPPHDHPLFQFDNVVVTPHVAGVSVEALRRAAAAAAEQWITILHGSKPDRVVNIAAWPEFERRYAAGAAAI